LPSMMGIVSVPANGVINPFTGLSYEILPFHATVHFAFNQQSGAVGAVLATLYGGTDLLHEESAISANARMPIWPDDYYLDDDIAAGDRIKVNLRNTTGGIIVVSFAARIVPIAA